MVAGALKEINGQEGLPAVLTKDDGTERIIIKIFKIWLKKIARL